VVDDEPQLCTAIATWLRGKGFGNVRTACNGKSALAILQKQSIDLLLTDVAMPVMDGMTLLRRLSEIGWITPSTVLLSGFRDIDQKEMYALGVEAFLGKPFESRQLFEALARALADRSSLWRDPMPEAPLQSIAIEVEDFHQVGSNDSIRIGRGGFSAPCPNFLNLARVAFQCGIRAKNRVMSGQGIVRWVSPEEHAVGIEFSFLDECCRAWILEEIASRDPRSFIPAG
jgi:CheY-like chemotaxis protein